MDRTVCILGAGPAGMAAALTCRQLGRDVTVYEKNSDVGGRFHGDLQGLENWSEEEDVTDTFRRLGIDLNFDCSPFKSVTVGNQHALKTFNFHKPLVYLVKRGQVDGSLDFGLKEQCLKNGVQFVFNCTKPLEEIDISCTGPSSKGVFAIDKGYVFKTDLPDMMHALINDGLTMKGYAYLLVSNGYACLASCIFDSFPKVGESLDRAVAYFKEHHSFDLQNATSVGGIGNFSVTRPFQIGSTLFAGEAAGIQDLLWGYGIRTAITSGALSARCLVEGKNYEDEARRYFRPKMKSSLVNRFVWERLGEKQYKRLFDLSVDGKQITPILRKVSSFRGVQRLMYPLAAMVLKKRYVYLSQG